MSIERIYQTTTQADGTVIHEFELGGFQTFLYMPASDLQTNLINYGFTGPTLAVFPDRKLAFQELASFARETGLLEIARSNGVGIVFMNPRGKDWSSEEPGAYEAMTGNLSIAQNNFRDGLAILKSDEIPDVIHYNILGSCVRMYVYGFGSGADYIAEHYLRPMAGTAVLGDVGQAALTMVCCTLVNGSVMPKPEKNDIHVVSVGNCAEYNAVLKEYCLDVKNGKVPLVLVFHGGGDSAYATASLAEWPEIGQDEGFLTVAVEMHLAVSAKDVSALIDHLMTEYSIDPERIYATGFSMGGIKSWDLYEQIPQRFAALMPMDAIDYVGNNCFGGKTDTVNQDTPVPLFYIGGVDSFGVELPCHHERAIERIAYVSKVNQFRAPYQVSLNDREDWQDPLYGVPGDRTEVLHDEMFPESEYIVHYFDSIDGKCYTALMGVTHHAHEIRPFTNRFAWNFVKHFRRTSAGIVIE